MFRNHDPFSQRYVGFIVMKKSETVWFDDRYCGRIYHDDTSLPKVPGGRGAVIERLVGSFGLVVVGSKTLISAIYEEILSAIRCLPQFDGGISLQVLPGLAFNLPEGR
jgi:hypothetical protein